MKERGIPPVWSLRSRDGSSSAVLRQPSVCCGMLISWKERGGSQSCSFTSAEIQFADAEAVAASTEVEQVGYLV